MRGLTLFPAYVVPVYVVPILSLMYYSLKVPCMCGVEELEGRGGVLGKIVAHLMYPQTREQQSFAL